MSYRANMAPTPEPSLSPADLASAKRMLAEVPFGYMAMVDRGAPYVLPLNFAYVPESDESGSSRDLELGLSGRIYFHTGKGRKTEALQADPRVCMAFTGRAAFERADSPCDEGFSFESLLIWGRARRLEDDADRQRGLRAIVKKYDPAKIDASFADDVFAGTLVYEVNIEAASCKERQPSD